MVFELDLHTGQEASDLRTAVHPNKRFPANLFSICWLRQQASHV
jgi:hypothetical protein